MNLKNNTETNKLKLKGLVAVNSLKEPLGGMNKSITSCAPFLKNHDIDLHFISVANIYRLIRGIYRIIFLEKMLHFDFIVFNSIASFLTFHNIGIPIAHLCLNLNKPVYIYWHETDWVFNSIENMNPSIMKKIDKLSKNKEIVHLTVSTKCDEFIKKRYNNATTRIVYNCTRIDKQFTHIVSPGSPPTVINIASIQERKGVDLFIETAIKVCKKNNQVEFLWIGNGHSYKRWQKDINKNKLEKRILFSGFLENPFILLRRASIFYLTSRDDPFPLSILEAMCLGREIIAFDIGGINEGLSGNGTLIRPFDIDSAVKAILMRLEKKPEELLNTSAIAHYYQNYTPQHLADRLNSVFREKIK